MCSSTMTTASPKSVDAHRDFLDVLPTVERHARFTFRKCNAVEREEAIAEAVAAAFVSFAELKSRGKNAAMFPSQLATFAALHVKDDRHVGGRRTSRDVL